MKRRIEANDVYARLSWVIVVGTIPAGLLGITFEHKFQHLFAAPMIVAVFLIANGILLYGVEALKQARKRLHNTRISGDAAISRMPWISAIITGCAQALALFPGFSRTGSSLAGGLISGLDHESAARFSFLLATPIILAAAVLKLPVLFHTNAYPVAQIGAGALASAIGAFVSVAFLIKYFKSNTMRPFAIYCVAAGLVSLVLLTR